MDIKQLRNFISIVDHKSFSKAAAFRNLSQPAISLSISNLEKEVDAQLLIRKRNEVTLTELGQAFILHARAALREIEKAEEIIDSVKVEKEKIIRIGLSGLISNIIAKEVLNEFCTLNSNIRVEVEVTAHDWETTHDRIASGSWDFGVVLGRTARPIAPDDMIIEHCLTLATRVHARKKHPLANLPHVSLEDLVDYDWTISTLTNGDGILEMFSDAGLKHPNIIAHVNSFNFIMALIEAGDLITVLPVQIIDTHFSDKFTQLRNPDFDYPASVNIIYSKDLEMTMAARKLKTAVGRYVKSLDK